MISAADSLPDDVEALKSLLRERDAELAQARATASNADALIAHSQLAIEKLRRELCGVRSERKARLLEQMELELEELEADANEDELAAEKEATKTTAVRAFSRRKPLRLPGLCGPPITIYSRFNRWRRTLLRALRILRGEIEKPARHGRASIDQRSPWHAHHCAVRNRIPSLTALQCEIDKIKAFIVTSYQCTQIHDVR